MHYSTDNNLQNTILLVLWAHNCKVVGTWNFVGYKFTGHISCISQGNFGCPHPPAGGCVSPCASTWSGS